jgi:YVTN family beta-propeller protein
LTARIALVSFAVTASLAASAAAGNATYHITRTVTLGAPDRWDLMTFDSATKRVYVTHGDRVTIVDGKTGSILGNVEGISGGTHGVAIVPSGNGYTDDGKAGEAIAFDQTTLKTGKHIKAQDDADDIAYDPSSGHLFVIDSEPGRVTVIDPKTDAVISTIDAGATLELSAVGNNGKLYVNGEVKNEIVRIDTATNAIDARWPMPGCESPHGLAIDRKTHRLFSSCANKVLTVVNFDSGAVVASIPIGLGTDGAAFDPTRNLILSSNGKDGTLSVIHEKDADHFEALDTVKTAVSGRTITIDPDSGRVYIAAAEIDTSAPVEPGKRPKLVPGSLKLIFLDQVN